MASRAPVARGLVPPLWVACANPAVLIAVPFQDQFNNASGRGWRECFTSSVGMLLMQRGIVASDDAYAKIRARYGDTTDVLAHLSAVRGFGLDPVFSQHFTRARLAEEIGRGVPVAVGWLHQGPSSRPKPGGHWSVVVGTSSTGVVMNDPAGEARLVSGGHIPGSSGREVRYGWRHWGPRWEVEGPGTGWAFFIRPSVIALRAA